MSEFYTFTHRLLQDLSSSLDEKASTKFCDIDLGFPNI